MTLPGRDALSAALERVLERFGARLRFVASRYHLRGDDLDELLQQVRLRLWQAQQQPDAIEATPASYVYRTAVTAALDLIRRKQARHEVLAADHEDGDMPDVATGTPSDRALGETELARIVAAAIDTIVESRRPVVRMYLAGYKPDEIAGALGWTTMKVRNLLYRGLTDLREALAQRGITAAGDTWTN
ncbi:MAG: sigma-70 family RNA polymerase sigma factor [Gemmatimonadetes bacterium]|nr:sigma-70 family RNA polymerase sigma factor [Gemmatimonadota bacterium]